MNRDKLIKMLKQDIKDKEKELESIKMLMKRDIDQMKLQLESLEYKEEEQNDM